MSREQDRELLEAAARASGYDYKSSFGVIVCNEIPGRWHPLESEADAFRLMVDCSIDVRIRENHARASNPYSDSDYTERFINHRSDKHAATRRAIVRAAAAMSEGQEG